MARRTAARVAEASGSGLFSGRACAIRVAPGVSGQGIRFGGLRASAAQRVAAPRRTVLLAGSARIETVEHFLAAVASLGFDDLDVTVTGGEIPIGDGSFQPAVSLLEAAGSKQQEGPRPRITVMRPVDVVEGESRYRIEPASALSVDVTLEYAQPVIGTQRFVGQVSPEWFVAEIGAARTFGFVAEIERAQRQGELLGAVDGTGIALESDRVVNTALRWPDEFVRHKVGDLLGDLALLGAPLAARVTAVRPSHEGNFACVQAILAAARYLEE